MNRAIGDVNVSVLAGPIEATSQPIHARIGQQVAMGTTGLYFHITPDVAAQWIGVLTPISKADNE